MRLVRAHRISEAAGRQRSAMSTSSVSSGLVGLASEAALQTKTRIARPNLPA